MSRVSVKIQIFRLDMDITRTCSIKIKFIYIYICLKFLLNGGQRVFSSSFVENAMYVI